MPAFTPESGITSTVILDQHQATSRTTDFQDTHDSEHSRSASALRILKTINMHLQEYHTYPINVLPKPNMMCN